MKIGFFGAGKMAEGILSAIPNKRDVIMAEKVPARAKELKRKYGVKMTDDIKVVAKAADLVFLAVRPQDVESVATVVKPLVERNLNDYDVFMRELEAARKEYLLK